MLKSPVAVFFCLALLTLGGCGFLSALGTASQDSAALQERYTALDERMKQVQDLMDAYGPLAEDLGPEVKEQYEKILAEYARVQDFVAEGKNLLNEALDLHQRSMAEATDESGKTDWMQYALLMLAGGGGLVSERRKTAKERNKLHSRIDDKSDRVKALEEAMVNMMHAMEVDKALNAPPPSA